MDPLLKWAGGKRWQVPLLKSIWFRGKHQPRRLVELFCGGLSVTLGLEPDRALLNDANPHLINFYRHVQVGLHVDLDLNADNYTAYRDWFNDLIRTGLASTSQAAQLFWYLNKFGFNGLCRFNADGYFNVPVGRGTPREAFSPHLARISLARYEFTCGDFRNVPLEPEDFVYADPPYDDGFTHYTGAAFTWDDQEALVSRLAGHDGPVIITNLATDRVLDLYRTAGYHTHLLDAPRRISSSGDRAPVQEVLATNLEVIL